jgi:hypothetical protein
MKKYLLLMGLLFATLSCVTAQSHTESFSTCGKTFKIKCESQIDNSIKVSVIDGITDSLRVEYKIWTNDMEVFAIFFQQHFSDSTKLADTCKTKEKEKWLAYGRELLRNYITSLQNTAPNAGIFKLQDSVTLNGFYIHPMDKSDTIITHKNGKADTVIPLKKYKVDTIISVKKYKVVRLQAEINDGYLENIVVYISNGKKIMRFTLPFPVGMSSVNNFKKYSKERLYDLDSSPFLISKDWAHPQFFIKLSDIIDYDYYLGVKRRDYSPKDTSLDIQGGTSLILHKEETKKLFEAHIFSDFQGLNENKPNGLIQAEINKRININTIQYLSKRYLYWFFGSYGYFQYIAPSVTVSKIEQHNKRLLLSDLDSVRLNPGATDTSLFSKNYHRYTISMAFYRDRFKSLLY